MSLKSIKLLTMHVNREAGNKMSVRNVFPFTAVLGQNEIKRALILNVINPEIGGVLISGQKGTAKSTLVRGFGELLTDMEVVELPLNVTEDRLIGSIDIVKAIKQGKRCFESGILKKANGNILYIDEVNLLSDYIADCLFEVSASHINNVEREGISISHGTQFVLIGTMNPEEGELRPQFLDRFGLYVEAKGSEDIVERTEIIRRRLEYENDPEGYRNKWKKETKRLSEEIKFGKRLLPFVKVSQDNTRLAAEIASEGNCEGHRGEIAIMETARAIAAFDSRKYITPEDIKQAAQLALGHRIRKMPDSDFEEQIQHRNNKSPDARNEEVEQKDTIRDKQQGNEEKAAQENNNFNGDGSRIQDKSAPVSMDKENVDEPGREFKVRPIKIKVADRKKRKGSGRRLQTATSSVQGRYIRYTYPKNNSGDVAFDATLRAAALHQRFRKKDGVAVAIEKCDLREKVREKRIGSTILFIVDASGSMGARQRMKAVKGAIVSLLNDAYQKRDRVGMISFRKNSAELLLGITRSVDLAEKCLRNLPTGGKTPLSMGLYRGYELIKSQRIKDPDIVPIIVLVSDGRANVSVNGDDPVEEAISVAHLIAAESIKSVVIDTENDFIKLGIPLKIAQAMDCEYYKLEDLEEVGIEYVVRDLL